MQAAAFDEENTILDGPPNAPPGTVEPISVYAGAIDSGIPVIVSCWKPTAEELEEIQRTGRVWVIVMGTRMPPIRPTGFSPFRHET